MMNSRAFQVFASGYTYVNMAASLYFIIGEKREAAFLFAFLSICEIGCII